MDSSLSAFVLIRVALLNTLLWVDFFHINYLAHFFNYATNFCDGLIKSSSIVLMSSGSSTLSVFNNFWFDHCLFQIICYILFNDKNWVDLAAQHKIREIESNTFQSSLSSTYFNTVFGSEYRINSFSMIISFLFFTSEESTEIVRSKVLLKDLYNPFTILVDLFWYLKRVGWTLSLPIINCLVSTIARMVSIVIPVFPSNFLSTLLEIFINND